MAFTLRLSCSFPFGARWLISVYRLLPYSFMHSALALSHSCTFGLCHSTAQSLLLCLFAAGGPWHWSASNGCVCCQVVSFPLHPRSIPQVSSLSLFVRPFVSWYAHHPHTSSAGTAHNEAGLAKVVCCKMYHVYVY